MLRLVILGAIIAAAAAQSSMISQLMARGGASGGAGGMMAGLMGGRGGAMSGITGMMNNPVWLCRNTESLKMVPCQHFKQICDIISFQTYNLPNILTCSPMGLGCCIKDALTYAIVQRLGK